MNSNIRARPPAEPPRPGTTHGPTYHTMADRREIERLEVCSHGRTFVSSDICLGSVTAGVHSTGLQSCPPPPHPLSQNARVAAIKKAEHDKLLAEQGPFAQDWVYFVINVITGIFMSVVGYFLFTEQGRILMGLGVRPLPVQDIAVKRSFSNKAKPKRTSRDDHLDSDVSAHARTSLRQHPARRTMVPPSH